ncbi:uncharacterized protein LTR77_000593 [Saxophila tyrrhenica]|uniref:Peptidase S33 tripeptidyl aminopeptidase-like C-terminal domain-containing protein n=1 Tax=Saxophila tyrrhenica TaxID=1690608 RepID=A0AAV9PNF9_9PEZI|nr:hypothetical protein LTR77_000593 [Saxophila tyrrhenica]
MALILMQYIPSTRARRQSADSQQTPAYKDLVWHNCYGDFKCARLEVPMDWHGTSEEASKTVELALVKVDALVPITDKNYGGAVVLNPGGPGGSGVGQVLRGGHHVQKILSAGPDADEHTAKYFDIIGFDPRGVNNTRPLFTCFPDHLAAAAWALEEDANGFMDTSDIAFDNVWASKRAMAEGCSKRWAEEGLAKHMDTAPVARDIVEIFERHGEWREKEAKWLLSLPEAASYSEADREEMAARTKYKPGKEMVQYWGFSYGTILGSHLATMYPDRIHRAVLDGVADSHDYMAAGWTTNLRDTDMLVAKFAEYCHEGGPGHCAMYHEDGPAVIAGNVQKAMTALKHNPISVSGNSTYGPEIVTDNDLKRLLRDIVYNPLRELPTTAQVMHEILQGSAPTLADWKRKSRPAIGESLSYECERDGPYSASCHTTSQSSMIQWEATYGIACTDGSPRTGETKEEFKQYADKLMASSGLIGAAWASIMLPCTSWHARPHWRYDGNFHNTTAHPILFVGNTFDPVTPLHNAFVMAKGFEGAGVLHQDSEGHCTYASPSMCSGRALREYFQTGTLPGKMGGLEDWEGMGKVCGVDRVPFDGYEKGSTPGLPEGETDRELWEAMVGLNQVWP